MGTNKKLTLEGENFKPKEFTQLFIQNLKPIQEIFLEKIINDK